ncbi:hypothetical protein FQN54_002300 [Arachnomyces sp. PD_36]|nr:hypothetical protein FQN54_002300 [Arachnomyces sp. PD_36]
MSSTDEHTSKTMGSENRGSLGSTVQSSLALSQPHLGSSTAAWNTKSLGFRLATDAASAASAAALICPIITCIDRAIIEKAAKGLPIRKSLTSSLTTLVTRPHVFFRSTPFLLIYMLYSSTYLTANLIDTTTSTLKDKSFSDVSAGPAKFIATSAVNMSLCVYKDSRFARIFGAQHTPQPQSQPNASNIANSAAKAISSSVPTIPKKSYALFCLRDSLTIFASFNIPVLIAPSIPDSIASTYSMKYAMAQFACPALVQTVSTPMHLLGLDLYNRQPPGGLKWQDRWGRIRRDWVVSCFARIGRIVPAYGVGGVVNVRLRTAMMKGLEEGEGQREYNVL